MKYVLMLLAALAGVAHAEDLDPCADGITDPVPTPVRDVAIDAQRAACLRDELSSYGQLDILIDTPGFHGELGGDLRLGGRTRIARAFELSAGVRLLRYAFAQNAVNKVTAMQLGPVTVGGAYVTRLGDGANVGLTTLFEVPYTRDATDTLHTSGELGAVVTAALTRRMFLHARLGMVWMYASSAGGSTSRIATRAGFDLVQRLGRGGAVGVGFDSESGWYPGFDHLALRLSAQWRIGNVWRGAVGVGLPIAGAERTNAIVTIGLLRDLR